MAPQITKIGNTGVQYPLENVDGNLSAAAQYNIFANSLVEKIL